MAKGTLIWDNASQKEQNLLFKALKNNLCHWGKARVLKWLPLDNDMKVVLVLAGSVVDKECGAQYGVFVINPNTGFYNMVCGSRNKNGEGIILDIVAISNEVHYVRNENGHKVSENVHDTLWF